MKWLWFLFLIFPLISKASPFGFTENQWSSNFEFSTVTTTKNYDGNGNLVSINSNSQFSENRIDLGSTYDFSNFWGAHANLNFKQVKSQGTNYDYTSTGPGELTLGADLQALDEFVKIIPDFFVTFPLSTQPGSDGNAFLGDGAFIVGGQAYISKNFWVLRNSVYGGLKWRSQGLSSQVPLGLLTRAKLSRLFFLNLNLISEISLGNDDYTATPSTRSLTQIRYNGGSAMYNSLNPSFFEVKIGGGWNLSPSLEISLSLQKTVLGQRVADETRFFANLGFVHKRKPSKNMDSIQDKFQVDTERE